MQSNTFTTEPGNRILAIFDDAVIVDTLASGATWADVAFRCDELLASRFGQLRSVNITVATPTGKRRGATRRLRS